jgi:hypothetical protein
MDDIITQKNSPSEGTRFSNAGNGEVSIKSKNFSTISKGKESDKQYFCLNDGINASEALQALFNRGEHRLNSRAAMQIAEYEGIRRTLVEENGEEKGNACFDLLFGSSSQDDPLEKRAAISSGDGSRIGIENPIGNFREFLPGGADELPPKGTIVPVCWNDEFEYIIMSKADKYLIFDASPEFGQAARDGCLKSIKGCAYKVDAQRLREACLENSAIVALLGQENEEQEKPVEEARHEKWQSFIKKIREKENRCCLVL